MADTTPKCVLCNHHGLCTIQGSGKLRVTCTGEKQDCRYGADVSSIKRKIKHHVTSISSVAATKIASGHNQTATAIFVGKRGKGKSMAALSVMEGYAGKISVLLGSNPWEAEPERYFPIKDLPNVGIIGVEDIMKALNRMKEPEAEHGGFILDDAGKFMDARDFMSRKNKVINKIFQTCRTKHVFAEITIPDDAGLDKDPRENSDFFCIMEQSVHDRGLSIGRFFEQNKQYRSGRMWYVYLRTAGNPIMRHTFKLPSQALIDEYEPKRSRMADELFNASMDELKIMLSPEENGKKEKGIPKRAYLPIIQGIKDKLGKKITDKTLCDAFGISTREYYNYKAGDIKINVSEHTNDC